MDRMTTSANNARNSRGLWVLALMIIGTVVTGITMILLPLPLDPFYHEYVDRRAVWGIPNAGNVLSGVAIVMAGLAGLVLTQEPRNQRWIKPFGNYWPFAVFFASCTLAGVGSIYYHLDPTTEALFWSRLPIAAAFMSLLTIFVVDRITVRVDHRLVLPLLVGLGIACLLHWYQSEVSGQGDQRFYALSQIAVVVALPLLWRLNPGRITRGRHAAILILFYCLALATELFDWLIFALLGEMISGHTLKHILSAAAICTVMVMLRSADVAPQPRGVRR